MTATESPLAFITEEEEAAARDALRSWEFHHGAPPYFGGIADGNEGEILSGDCPDHIRAIALCIRYCRLVKKWNAKPNHSTYPYHMKHLVEETYGTYISTGAWQVGADFASPHGLHASPGKGFMCSYMPAAWHRFLCPRRDPEGLPQYGVHPLVVVRPELVEVAS